MIESIVGNEAIHEQEQIPPRILRVLVSGRDDYNEISICPGNTGLLTFCRVGTEERPASAEELESVAASIMDSISKDSQCVIVTSHSISFVQVQL